MRFATYALETGTAAPRSGLEMTMPNKNSRADVIRDENHRTCDVGGQSAAAKLLDPATIAAADEVFRTEIRAMRESAQLTEKDYATLINAVG
jgi:DNA-binding transcriptional regulator YiaG